MKPPVIEWTKLPLHLRHNWHVQIFVRECSRIPFCKAVADATGCHPDSQEYHEAWVLAAHQWVDANPDYWKGDWPADSAIYPGSGALEEARRYLGL